MSVPPARPVETRRAFLLAGAGLAAANVSRAQSAGSVLTAGAVIERIKTNVGIPWRPQTVDNIIAGSADTPVQGIATTMMATLDVVQHAAAAERNMVITHEPTFFSHQDKTYTIANDPTNQFKLDFLAKHQMIVFHFHDHWHGHRPDGISTGILESRRPRLASRRAWRREFRPKLQ